MVSVVHAGFQHFLDDLLHQGPTTIRPSTEHLFQVQPFRVILLYLCCQAKMRRLIPGIFQKVSHPLETGLRCVTD